MLYKIHYLENLSITSPQIRRNLKFAVINIWLLLVQSELEKMQNSIHEKEQQNWDLITELQQIRKKTSDLGLYTPTCIKNIQGFPITGFILNIPLFWQLS